MRSRSIEEKYREWTIKEYRYWTLLLHDDQRYLGRAYVWLARGGGMQRFSELTDAENAELRIVMREYEKALEDLWHPDFMNYAWLANLIHEHGGHGHLHLIPRYKHSRVFAGMQFIDGRWGNNYSPYEKFKPSRAVLVKIRAALKNAIT